MDEEGILELRDTILDAARDYYLARQGSCDRVFEVLNALAAATALILKGTGNDRPAHDFFAAALDQNIKGEGDA